MANLNTIPAIKQNLEKSTHIIKAKEYKEYILRHVYEHVKRKFMVLLILIKKKTTSVFH